MGEVPMKTALVCGKWELPLLPGEANQLANGSKGYYEYINERTAETGRNAICVEWLMERMPKGLTVAEHFGGVGVFALIAQEVLKPKRHLIFDIDGDCLRQLRGALGGRAGVDVRHGDAEQLLGQYAAEFYLLDFPFFTIKRYPNWQPHWDLMLANQPAGVLWMDGAARYLHLHLQTYSEAFGEEITTPESYARAMSNMLLRRNGYAIEAMAYSQGCFYFLATPGVKTEPLAVRRVGAGENGFRWEQANV